MGSSNGKVEDSSDRARQRRATWKPKLHYFGFPGRGEFIRMMFAAAEQPYEDFRFGFEEWPDLKSKYPLQAVPVLEVDGKLLPESIAIGRFVARETGLLAKDSFMQAVGDAVVDVMRAQVDLFVPIVIVLKDEAKEEASKKFCEENIPKLHTDLGKLLELSGSKDSGHVCGKELTWVDIYICWVVQRLANVEPDIETKYPIFGRIKKQVEALPAIAKYLKEHAK